MTAQERPEGLSKSFREDLLKKMMSGDGIFGRLPYQILTKVIHLVGWKRMELNRLVRFTGVTDRIVHSMSKRCLTIRMQRRSVHPVLLFEAHAWQ